jgi:hypothetical protein
MRTSLGSWGPGAWRADLVGSDEVTITGETTFRWLPGGFFLEQHGKMNFLGMGLDTLELIGCEPQTRTFPSTVYANISPQPLPYRWEVEGDTLKISVSYGPLDATFTGRFSEDGQKLRRVAWF